MKKAAFLSVAVMLGFMALQVTNALGVAGPEIDYAAGAFSGSEPNTAPTTCAGEDGAPAGSYASVTLVGTGGSVDHSPSVATGQAPWWTANDVTGNGTLSLTTNNRVNTATGAGVASGPFNLTVSSTKRIHGTFNAVTQITNPVSQAAIGRGFIKGTVQKKVNGVFTNTSDQVWANIEFQTNGTGGFTGAFGFFGDGSAPFNGGGTGTEMLPSVPNLSVGTTNKPC
jgi:hypothetical protein